MAHTRVPDELWDRVKTAAEALGQSAAATAARILEETLDSMEAKTPALPPVVTYYHAIRDKAKKPKSAKQRKSAGSSAS